MPLSKSALAAVFRRSGAPGEHTTLLQDARTEIKQLVENKLREKSISGEPVVVTMFSQFNWSVITTHAMLVAHEGEVKIASRDDVVTVEPAWHDGADRKSDLNTLAVTLRDGSTLLIRTDAGRPFSGVWNVLKTFEAEGRNAASTH
jgi:hypothetical protein